METIKLRAIKFFRDNAGYCIWADWTQVQPPLGAQIMSNTNYVASRRPLATPRFDRTLKEIVAERLPAFEVSSTEYENGTQWRVQHSVEAVFGVELWFETRRRVGLAEDRLGYVVSGWVCAVLMNELGARMQGNLSSDALGEVWAPDTTKYPTLQSWIDTIHPTSGSWLREAYGPTVHGLLEAPPGA